MSLAKSTKAFKNGDIVKCINGFTIFHSNTNIKEGDYYIVDDVSNGLVYLVERKYIWEGWSVHRFRKVDPATLTKLEKILHGL